MSLLSSMIRKLDRLTNQLDVANYAVLVMGVVVVGCICMRGFGNRLR